MRAVTPPPDHDSAGLPSRIGHYRIEERLGAGGMGVVYRAFDDALQRPLAIKRVLSDRVDPARALRFRREARMAARLNHPSIVHIYEIIETDEGDWIVMELVEGKTLDRMLARRHARSPKPFAWLARSPRDYRKHTATASCIAI